ncbi:hypothetical protein [Microcoleus sp. FACHB-1515]|uniref:hypothetical protein n=1 Tax=Microcoleus sp. FACHB-1515 TaxID=2692821 RepID=UPI0028C3A96E|nr:hypothetical protein [Microcoleus sp. FACHB-1515]
MNREKVNFSLNPQPLLYPRRVEPESGMVDATIAQAHSLKQALLDFVMDAEDDLAQALETYAADRTRAQKSTIPQALIVDAFLTEGRVGGQTPIDLFLAAHPDLSQSDRTLVESWKRSFTGLFAVEEILPDGFEWVNWLTNKHYIVKPASDKDASDLARLKPGEIVLTRIAPVGNEWMLSAPVTFLGKLGKPKLAVAIGNFRDAHKASLYSDAPELLEQAWQSVVKYHDAFLEFFGSDRVAMSGYELNKKMTEFSSLLSKRQLAEAGIDESKSIADLVAETDMSEEELAEAAKEAGVDAAVMKQALKNPQAAAKMMAPQVQLPDAIKKAESVTVLADPRWGQMLLPLHDRFKAVLQADDWRSVEGSEKLVRHYLTDPSINYFVWQQLAQEYPQAIERVLQDFLNRPDFQIADLAAVLAEQGKAIEPELPEIASVPIHLHTLFEDAIAEVNKSKPKAKKAQKTGFGR